jgi:hypothetical protein
LNADDLYNQFVEEYFAAGEAEIPSCWPAELRKRCVFFLKMLDNHEDRVDHRARTLSSSSARSLLATLEDDGLRADLSLPGSTQQRPTQQ